MASGGWYNFKVALLYYFGDGRPILAKLKKVVLFLDFFIGTVMVRADTVIGFNFGFGEESFVAGAVPTDVFTLVNILFQFSPNELGTLFVTGVSGAYEAIV